MPRRHARNPVGIPRLKSHVKHVNVLLVATLQRCGVSAPPVVVQLFSKLPDLWKPLLVKLTWLRVAAAIDGENRMGLVRMEVNAQLYQRECQCTESFDSTLQYFRYNFRKFFWAVCKEMAYISWSFCTHRTVLWGLSSGCLCSLSEYQPLKWRYLNGHAEITITQMWPRLVINKSLMCGKVWRELHICFRVF